MLHQARSEAHFQFSTLELLVWTNITSAFVILSWLWMNVHPASAQLGYPFLISGPVATFLKFDWRYFGAGVATGLIFMRKVGDVVFYFEGVNKKDADRVFALLDYQYLLVAIAAGFTIGALRLIVIILKTYVRTINQNH